MALSGSYGKNVSSHYRLQWDWTATQNIAANQSTVTVKLYWMGTDSYSALSSSSSRTSAIQINDGTWSTETTTPALKANQKKLINTYSKTLNHNSDGTCTFSIDAYFDLDFTLGSTKYTRIDLDQQDYTLNRIPRASTINGSASWTAGTNYSLNIDRASTSFSHTAKFYVRANSTDTWSLVKTVENISSSTAAINFTDDENKLIFNKVSGNTTGGETRIVLDTYNGSSLLGDDSKDGTLTIPGRQTLYDIPNFSIGETIAINLENVVAYFVSNIAIYVEGVLITTLRNISENTTVNTSTFRTQMLAALGTSKTEGEIRYDITTYYKNDSNAIIRNGAISKYGVVSAPLAPPNFSGTPAYYDNNPRSVTITGSNQQLIQGLSSLMVSIPSSQLATGNNGATIVSYTASFGALSKTTTLTSGNILIDLGTVPTGGTGTLKITATDSRGGSTTISKSLTVIPYLPPVITATNVRRANGFDSTVYLSFGATYNPVLINGANKNTITLVSFKYKLTTATTWSNPINMTMSTSGTSVQTNISTLNNINTELSYDVVFSIKDSISNTEITKAETIKPGTPLVFMNTEKNSVGINKFPTRNNALEIAGLVDVTGNVQSGGNLVGKNVEATGTITTQGAISTTGSVTGGTGNFPNLNVSSLASLNGSAEMLRFEMSTYAYMAWWLNGVRQGYLGFGSAGTTTFTIKNEKTNKALQIGEELVFEGKKIHHDGNMVIETGTVKLSTGGSNVNKTVAQKITFKSNFPAAPRVMVTGQSTAPQNFSASADNITATEAYVQCRRSTDSNTDIMWVAVWEPFGTTS